MPACFQPFEDRLNPIVAELVDDDAQKGGARRILHEIAHPARFEFHIVRLDEFYPVDVGIAGAIVIKRHAKADIVHVVSEVRDHLCVGGLFL
ncbi:hypothetical protein D3C72_1468770 [compost metagenome]